MKCHRKVLNIHKLNSIDSDETIHCPSALKISFKM